ncbi:hypothetical protein [Streptomyces sp. NPDC093984]|uniref:hypothetical protein n=1 Tax=Streptomyces sp. NPDC093984 TaxID=3366052 RepID=UPI0038278485
MSSEMNRRVVLRTAAGVAGAVSLSPLPPAGNEDYQAVSRALGTTINMQPASGNTYGTSGSLDAPDEAYGIAPWSRPAGPRPVRRPRTDPHPKGKDPS